MTPLEKAALAWWREGRPVAWNEAQHLENPDVNRSMNGARLARAVATMVKKKRGEKK